MRSAARSENANLKQQLAEQQLDAARQAKADSDLRREEVEAHAQALRLQPDELLQQRSTQPKFVPEPSKRLRPRARGPAGRGGIRA
jgi:hypothetical protein